MAGRWTDPLCVDGAEFLAEVQPIRDAWEKRHLVEGADSRGLSYWSTNEWTHGPFAAMLAEHTGINPRRVHGIFTGAYPQVPLTQADEILVALDRPDIMAGLTVYRRKRASADNGRGPYVLTPLAA